MSLLYRLLPFNVSETYLLMVNNVFSVRCLPLCQMDYEVKACGECSRKCLLFHRGKCGLPPKIPPFFKVMFGKGFAECLVCGFKGPISPYFHSIIFCPLILLF